MLDPQRSIVPSPRPHKVGSKLRSLLYVLFCLCIFSCLSVGINRFLPSSSATYLQFGDFFFQVKTVGKKDIWVEPAPPPPPSQKKTLATSHTHSSRPCESNMNDSRLYSTQYTWFHNAFLPSAPTLEDSSLFSERYERLHICVTGSWEQVILKIFY